MLKTQNEIKSCFNFFFQVNFVSKSTILPKKMQVTRKFDFDTVFPLILEDVANLLSTVKPNRLFDHRIYSQIIRSVEVTIPNRQFQIRKFHVCCSL